MGSTGTSKGSATTRREAEPPKTIQGMYGVVYNLVPKDKSSVYGNDTYYENNNGIYTVHKNDEGDNIFSLKIQKVNLGDTDWHMTGVSDGKEYTIDYKDNKDKPIQKFNIEVNKFSGKAYTYNSKKYNVTVYARTFADVKKTFAKAGSSTVKKK